MTAANGNDQGFAGNGPTPDKCYQNLFYQAPVASLLVGRDGRILEVNRRAVEMLALDPEKHQCTNLKQLFSTTLQKEISDHLAAVFLERCQKNLEVSLQLPDEQVVAARMIIVPIEGENEFCQVTLLDLNEQLRDDMALSQLAYYDQLTGLPNRLLFSDRLHWAIRDARRQNERLAVMVIDMDNFKQINDSMGHEAGDTLLQTMAGRMNACLREADTLSRMSGDEFTVLILHTNDNQDVEIAATRLLESISQPFEIKGRQQSISASIGICIYPDDGDSGEQLIHNADIAMYRSKNSGRNQISFFSKSMKAAVSRQTEMEQRLRQAMAAQELEVYYQPVFDAATNRIIGLEALIRWRTRSFGLMTAGQFLPLARQLGLADDFEEWALKQACAQMKDWMSRGIIRDFTQCRMAVNLSAEKLATKALPAYIRSILQTAGLPPSSFAVDIAETILRQGNPIVLENLSQLRQQGILLHLDDFSQGFGSLHSINKAPFEYLKVDQNCTSIFLENQEGETLLDALFKLSHTLGLRVIAEGVETEQAYAWLKEHDCDGMQGYYFCRPLPVVKMEMLLALPQSN